MIDDIDKQILEILQKDGRTSNAEIARQVNLAASAVLERVRKLEDHGVILGYAATVSPRSVDFPLTAFVSVRTSECNDVPDNMLVQIPEVLEVHDVAGEDSYLLKVRAADPEDLSVLLRKIKSIPTVVSTNTTVVLQTVKETTALPLYRCATGETTKKKK